MFKMKLLPHWCLQDLRPAFYDTESATAIGQTAKLYGAMNKLIESYNAWIDEVNKTITEFNNETDQDIECFKRAITELCNNYIATMDMKIDHQDRKIEETIVYMKENIYVTVKTIIDEMKESGELDEAILASFETVNQKVIELESLITSEVEKIFLLQQDNITNKQEIATNKQNIEALKDKVNTLYFDNVAAMKNSTKLNSGDTVQTLGYYEVNDGGAAIYKVRDQKATDIENGAIHLLNKGLVAEIIMNNSLNFKQFGVKFDGVTDSTISLQNAINYGKTNIKGCSGTVCISSPINIEVLDEKVNIDFKEMTIKCISEEIIDYVLKIKSKNGNRVYGKIQNLYIDSNAKSKIGLYINDCRQFNIDNIEICSSTEYEMMTDKTGSAGNCTLFLNDGRFVCGTYYGYEECSNASALNVAADDSHFENVVTLDYIKHIIVSVYALFNKIHSWNWTQDRINDSTMFVTNGAQLFVSDSYCDSLQTMVECNARGTNSGSVDIVNPKFYLNPSFYLSTHNDPLPIKVNDEFINEYGKIRITGGVFKTIEGKYGLPFINYNAQATNFRETLIRLTNVCLGKYKISKYFQEYSRENLLINPSADLTTSDFYLSEAITMHGCSIINISATLKGLSYGSYIKVGKIVDEDFVVKSTEAYPMHFINNSTNQCVTGVAKILSNKDLQIRIPVTEGFTEETSITMRGTIMNILNNISN